METKKLNLNCECGGFLVGLCSVEDADVIAAEFWAMHDGPGHAPCDERTAITAFAMRTVRECAPLILLDRPA